MQERKQNDNADNPLCLGIQIHHESTHRYFAEGLTSPMIYSMAITLYLLTMVPINRFSAHLQGKPDLRKRLVNTTEIHAKSWCKQMVILVSVTEERVGQV